ncbi:MAG: hypothetical protein CM1200mP3_00260 [Chloroflexota bacterium]|nr:MAG: hypothetical protein CM1200mP3_00260 [Chloroflexota bacterium]
MFILPTERETFLVRTKNFFVVVFKFLSSEISEMDFIVPDEGCPYEESDP